MVDQIRRQILAGEQPPGSRLPTEPELSEAYTISVSSVRRGIDHLVSENLIDRRQGSGMFVRQPDLALRPTLPVTTGTVGLVAPLHLQHYHPFFSEELRGVRERLNRLGFRVVDASPAIRQEAQTGDITRTYELDFAAAAGLLNEIDDLVGVVVGGTLAQTLRPYLARAVTMVALDEADEVPYVAYDWPRELALGLHTLSRQGARQIWVNSQMAPDPALASAADARWEWAPGSTPVPSFTSQIIHEAYTRTLAALDADPSIDAILAGDDFVSQGCLDATAQHLQVRPRPMQLFCIRSTPTQLRTALRPLQGICDGFAKGEAVADLLHQHMSLDPHPPRVVMLSARIAR